MDDEKDIASSLKRGLEIDDYLVEAFCDPQEVLHSYNSGEYDLFMLDIAMPGISGLEPTNTIKRMDPKPHVWFVTASESCLNDSSEKYPNIEGSIFIKKSISLRELKFKLNSELRSKQ